MNKETSLNHISLASFFPDQIVGKKLIQAYMIDLVQRVWKPRTYSLMLQFS